MLPCMRNSKLIYEMFGLKVAISWDGISYACSCNDFSLAETGATYDGDTLRILVANEDLIGDADGVGDYVTIVVPPGGWNLVHHLQWRPQVHDTIT